MQVFGLECELIKKGSYNVVVDFTIYLPGNKLRSSATRF